MTISYREALYGLARSLGMSPEQEGLQRSIAGQMTEGFNTAYKISWQFYDWPQICPVVQVETQDQWLPQGSIGELFSVCDSKGVLSFYIRPGGVSIPDAKGLVTIRYRPPPPEFTSVPYDPAKAYRAGDLVWDDAETGHVYSCVAPNTGASLSSAANWTPVPVMKFLAEATKTGARALYLQAEQQWGSAQIVNTAVLSLLEHEIMLVQNQQSHVKTYAR